MKVLVGSLQYSPVFKSHCCALGGQCEKEGHTVKYLLSSNYGWMLPKRIKQKTYFIGKSSSPVRTLFDGLDFRHRRAISKFVREEKPDYVYMHNLHPFLNHVVASTVREQGGVFIQHVHEPFVKNKAVYGRVKSYWLSLFEKFQERLLRKTDIAIVSSKEAFLLFKRRYTKFRGQIVQIPLMYEDRRPSDIERGSGKYITFVGPPVPAKDPGKFLELVRYSEKKGLGLRFLLISRSRITDSEYFKYSNLQIYQKRHISDSEFGDVLLQSIAVVTPYKTARQSSVVLTSYMYGVPVVATDITGLREFVRHERTGYLVDTGSAPAEWIEGIDFVQRHQRELSSNCRTYFEETFSEINWPRYFAAIFHPKTTHTKLEIGCGRDKVFEDSVGVDIRKTPCVDIVADARKLPFKDSCFDQVYSSHLIEHFSHRIVKEVLHEWIRVLKLGGEFELRCPDLQARALIFSLRPSWKNVENIYGGQDYYGNYHQCGFSYRMLKELLEQVGIKRVRRILRRRGYIGIPFLPDCLHVKGVKASC